MTENANDQIPANEPPVHIHVVSEHSRPRKVYAGMWGIPEIAVVSVGGLALLLVVIFYALVVIPAQRDLDANTARRNDLEKELKLAQERYGTITSTKEKVAELVRSADDFETRFLRSENESKVALYQRINGLIGALGLTNTSGPDYTPLDVIGDNRTKSDDQSTGRSKHVSIFPGVYVTMTVDGSYQNLRRFVREIEASGEFVVISSIELEPSEMKERKSPQELAAQPSPETTQSKMVDKGKTYGETVTLRIELASYYRRPGFSTQPLDPGANQ